MTLSRASPSSEAAILPNWILVGRAFAATGELERDHERNLDLVPPDLEADEVKTAWHVETLRLLRTARAPVGGSRKKYG